MLPRNYRSSVASSFRATVPPVIAGRTLLLHLPESLSRRPLQPKERTNRPSHHLPFITFPLG